MVFKNLNENGFIDNNQYLQLKKKEIRIKRRKIEIVNEANSYTEEVRRIIKDKYGFEKLYSEGLSIKTPLNIDYQIQALKSLRKELKIMIKEEGGEVQLLIK